MNKREHFYSRNVELRAIGDDDDEDDDGEFAIEGYAATFHGEADLGDFRERVAPTAFTRALREGQDVRCLRNHDPNFILGRTKSGTLQLRCDDRGLRFRCALDRNNPEHRATHAMIKRGDMDACSFGFIPQKQSWSDQRGADGSVYALRTLEDVDLQDVSAVCYPAYQDGTEVNARSAKFFFPEGQPVEVRSAVEKFKTENPDTSATTEELRLQIQKLKLF